MDNLSEHPMPSLATRVKHLVKYALEVDSRDNRDWSLSHIMQHASTVAKECPVYSSIGYAMGGRQTQESIMDRYMNAK